jgi:uncharacterized protein with PIN domain
MTARLELGWQHRFRAVLEKVRPRRLEFGVDLLMKRSHALAERERIPAGDAFARMYEFTRWRVQRRLEKTGACWVDAAAGRDAFVCDPSLGGVARWLRAAGYGARMAGLEKAVEAARSGGAVALTTDSRVLDRGEVRARQVPVLWLPSGMPPPRQMGMVLRDLSLDPRTPLCMACGGRPQAVTKESVAARIPPRTAPWKDDYFVCPKCGRLFWQGTHWERITASIAAERPPEEDPGRP